MGNRFRKQLHQSVRIFALQSVSGRSIARRLFACVPLRYDGVGRHRSQLLRWPAMRMLVARQQIRSRWRRRRSGHHLEFSPQTNYRSWTGPSQLDQCGRLRSVHVVVFVSRAISRQLVLLYLLQVNFFLAFSGVCLFCTFLTTLYYQIRIYYPVKS